MRVGSLHAWQLTTRQAIELQDRLAAQVVRTGQVESPRYIAGADINSPPRRRGPATAAVVVLSYPDLELVESQVVRGEVDFPYVPGLLSFRESPLTLEALRRLSVTPDLVLVDGQGVAHPRRIGLASHVGLFLDVPTIGCAKSVLCGTFAGPGRERGSYSGIEDGGEVIGAAVRTRDGVRPVYVSTGHRIALEDAVQWVLKCCRGFRLPEPTRLAHQAAGGRPAIARQAAALSR